MFEHLKRRFAVYLEYPETINLPHVENTSVFTK